MRITKDDVNSINLRVYFNGERHSYVQACDTEEGWIDAYKVENGVVVLTPENEVVIERKYGKVEVKKVED